MKSETYCGNCGRFRKNALITRRPSGRAICKTCSEGAVKNLDADVVKRRERVAIRVQKKYETDAFKTPDEY